MRIRDIQLADGTPVADLEPGMELWDIRSSQQGFFFYSVDLRHNKTMIICLDKNGDERRFPPCDLLMLTSVMKETPPAGLCRTGTTLKVGDLVWIRGFVKETPFYDNSVLIEIQTTYDAYESDAIYINFNRLFVEQSNYESEIAPVSEVEPDPHRGDIVLNAFYERDWNAAYDAAVKDWQERNNIT